METGKMIVVMWISLCYVLLAQVVVGGKLNGKTNSDVVVSRIFHGGALDRTLEHVGEECWWQCAATQGPCVYCGDGFCCRKNWSDTSNGCDGSIGGNEHHACVSPGASRGPSLARYQNAKHSLKSFILILPELGGLRRAALAGWVRLAFHDCVGPNGCDGCVAQKQEDNAGLDLVIATLEGLRLLFLDISIADWWQIAGIASLEVGDPNIDILFKGGRVDCSTSPFDDVHHDFPNPAMSRAEMMDWFAHSSDGFGMNENEVTALMGAHSLGGANKIFSGYNGEWTPGNTNVFNNEYYQRLNDESLIFTNMANVNSLFAKRGADLKFQWDVWDGRKSAFDLLGVFESHSFFLNTDIELAYDIDLDGTGSGTKCVIGNRLAKNRFFNLFSPKKENARPRCKEAATKNLVAIYAGDNARFIRDFKQVYEKMMTTKIKVPLAVPQ